MISFSTSEIVSYFEFQLLIIPTVHRRDVAFTLPQLSSLLSSASLLSIGSSEPRARLHLDLRARWQKWERNNLNIFVFRIKDPDLLAALERLEDEEREEISEIIAGAVSKHSIYLTKSKSMAEAKTSKKSMETKTKTKKLMETKTKVKPSQGLILESRVCVMGSEREGLWQVLDGRSKAGGWPRVVKNRLDMNFGLWRKIVDNLDNHSNCKKTVADIVHTLSGGLNLTDEKVLEELKMLLDFSSITGQLLIRSPGVTPSPLSMRYKKLFDKFYTIYD